MAEMTPRERVWAAVNHQEPDRVPLDIGGGTSTSILVEGYEKLNIRLNHIASWTDQPTAASRWLDFRADALHSKGKERREQWLR